MTAKQILEAFAEDGNLCEEVLGYLSHGVFDEWDASLAQGIDAGFGPAEWQISARTAVIFVKADESRPGAPKEGGLPGDMRTDSSSP